MIRIFSFEHIVQAFVSLLRYSFVMKKRIRKQETRRAVYDDKTGIEAYWFEGIVWPFPNHFHEYYVIGLVENGEKSFIVQKYSAAAGNIILPARYGWSLRIFFRRKKTVRS